MQSKSILITILTLLILSQLFWSSVAFATDYFVDANNGSNTNSGLGPDNAFGDLIYATRQLQPGDTLYLRAGIYLDIPLITSSGNYHSGTSTQPIVVRPYQGEQPIISGTSTFLIKDVSWWVIEDLIFQTSNKIKLGQPDTNLTPGNQCTSFAENIVIQRNRFQHGNTSSVSISCAKNIRIQDNLFDNIRSRIDGVDAFGIAFHKYANNIVITGNHFRDIGADGIQFLEQDGASFSEIEISGNEFEVVHPYSYRDENGNVIPPELRPFDSVGENAIDIKHGPGPILVTNNVVHGFRPTLEGQDASGAMGVGIVLQNTAHGVTLRKNYFYDNTIHLSVEAGNNNTGLPDRDTTISNNIFDHVVKPEGIYGGVADRTTGLRVANTSNIRVLNNTFHHQSGDQNALLFLSNISNVELKNNVFCNGKITTQFELTGNELNWGSFDVIADYNAWSGLTSEPNATLIGIHDVSTDNISVDWSTWLPMEGSPLIDAGTNVGITDDINNASISGLGPDIGAAEYQTSQSGDLTLLPDISIKQAGIPTRVIYPDEGIIKVTADIRNYYPGNDYSFDWSQSDNSLTAVSGYQTQTLGIDPSGMAPGIYRVHVNVTNNANASQHTEVDTLIEVSSVRPILDAVKDSDGDGTNDASEGSGDSDQDGIPDYLDAISDTSMLQGLQGVSDRYLLITEPGLSLRLGSIAFAAGQQSAEVTLETIAAFGNGTGGSAINADDGLAYSAGIYDFEVTGLGEAGQSVRVVLPLKEPIVYGTVFRKFHPVYGWQEFIINEHNSVASAPGSIGSCPAPSDIAYLPGLRAGDYCIQLTLEDGGPNDADGLRNGRIKDPSGAGVASQPSSNNTDGSSGAGCTISGHRTFDPLLILLLMISTAGIYRHRALH